MIYNKESIDIQRSIIRKMNTMLPENSNSKGMGEYCLTDRLTGKPLTYGEFFDMHAMTMMVIDEVEKRNLPH